MRQPRSHLVTVFAVWLALLAGVPASSTGAEVEYPGDRIAFAAGDHDDRAYWGVRPDESDPHPIAEQAGVFNQPAWSPDGSEFAFGHTRPGPATGTVTVHIEAVAWDGTQRRTLARFDRPDDPPLGVAGLAWSPDGATVAFGLSWDGLYLVDAEGSDLRRLTDPPQGHSDLQPSWAPESDRLAFTRTVPIGGGQPGTYHVHLVDADGSDDRFLIEGEAPLWSPDGRWIWCSCDRGDGDGGDLVRPDGSEVRDLPDRAIFGASWAPDATRVAFGDHEGLWVMPIDGRPPQLVSPPGRGEAAAPSWSPDGRWIAFISSVPCPEHQDPATCAYESDLFVVRPDGRDPSQLTDEMAPSEPAFSPGLGLRLAGRTRVQTAIDVSRHAFSAADTVVLARADLYPDALAGAPLAHAHQAPLLLNPREHLHPDVRAEVRRLGASTAFLLGSEAALSEQVEADLEAMGIATIRLGGADRFATARLIAARVGGEHVYVVEGKDPDPGRGWPDAVAVSALAAFQRRPILLVETDRLPHDTTQALDDLGATAATIVGGPPAVSRQVEADIGDRGIDVDRLEGDTRYTTSLAVAEVAVAAGMDAAETWLATGRDWPDALGAGPAVAARGGVLLLVDGRGLDGSPSAQRWLEEHAGRFARIAIVGGPDVVTAAIAVEAERRARP